MQYICIHVKIQKYIQVISVIHDRKIQQYKTSLSNHKHELTIDDLKAKSA